MRDKIQGMFLGIAIGDSLGMCCESMKADAIAEKFGRIQEYRPASKHKWMGDVDRGLTTDDWQLSKAVAEGMILGNGLNLDTIAAQHVIAYQQSVRGWGPTTKEAVERLVEGKSWQDCGKTDLPNRGGGNGVAMKVAPVGAYMAVQNPMCDNEKLWTESIQFLVNLGKMTHWSSMGVASGLCQAYGIFKCLRADPNDFNINTFIKAVQGGALHGQQFLPETIGQDNLYNRLGDLYNHDEWPAQRISEEYRGSSYVYESLPLTYMFFVKNWKTIDSLYDVVNIGGDTDSNGSMLASLLGALHGTKIFPEHLVNELVARDEVLDVANRFCDMLKV